MKIQITDRELWLNRVNDERQNLLDTYNAQPWYRQLFSGYNEEWSQMYAWYDMAVLRSINEALESKGTGDVYIDAEELMVVR